jgi:replication initiator protein A
VLTLHRDYFRLRKPLERRVYELARKHCGQQPHWKISLALLLKKTGSQSPEKRFRQMIRGLARHDHLPDYHVAFDDEADMVEFTNRGSMKAAAALRWAGQLDNEAYHDARQAAPGWDVYNLEQEWRQWLGENEIEPQHPARHFVKFCQSWYDKRGAA